MFNYFKADVHNLANIYVSSFQSYLLQTVFTSNSFLNKSIFCVNMFIQTCFLKYSVSIYCPILFIDNIILHLGLGDWLFSPSWRLILFLTNKSILKFDSRFHIISFSRRWNVYVDIMTRFTFHLIVTEKKLLLKSTKQCFILWRTIHDVYDV